MSDTGRQSLTDKFEASAKPDSQKSTTEHFGDKMKGHGDSALSSAQPQSEKSTSQKVGDTFSSNSNKDDRTLVEKTKETLGMSGKN